VESKVTGIPDIVQQIQQQQEQLGKPEAIVAPAGTDAQKKAGVIAGTVIGVGVGLGVLVMMLVAFKKKRPEKDNGDSGMLPKAHASASLTGGSRTGSPHTGSPRVGSSYTGSPRSSGSPRVGTPRVGTPRSGVPSMPRTVAGPVGEGDEAAAAAAFYQSRSLRAQAALQQPSSGGAGPKL
jgi:hypothetical protein